MKRTLIFTMLILASATAWSQESMVTLSGGYVFANFEDGDTDATGWRINGSFEFNPQQGKFAHGLSVGYISTSADYAYQTRTVENKVSSWPIYYAPKILFGGGSAKGFIKGALGVQFSKLKRSGALGDLETNDTGFYGGASAGFMKTFGEKIFINLEYEWAYLSNSYYKDGFMNSIMAGVGMKF
jgi:hypothetical protein